MTAAHPTRPDPGQKPSYPFREWLDGRQWVLTQGRDFWGDPDELTVSLRASSRARRLDVVCAWDPAQRCLYVRASPRHKTVT